MDARARIPRPARLAAGAIYLLASATAQGGHLVVTDVDGTRTPMLREGYLAYQFNPTGGRFGDEWTGWVDVRHPSLAGPRETQYGYDRSDRFLGVATTILDAPAAGGGRVVANDNRVVDFDYANKAYVYQAGVSVLETSVRGVQIASNFPLTHAAERAIMAASNIAAPAINLYYANGLASGANGETYEPSLIAGAGNEGIFKGSSAFQSTFAHELYHFVGDGQAVHQPLAADASHSSDQANIVRTTGININSLAEVGPVLSATVGGKLQITSAQAERIFSAPGVAPFFPASQRGDRDAYGDRVDWDFVVDHNRFDNGGKTFGLEGVGSGVDNHLGVDSLFWGIGPTVPVFQNPPGAANGGHDHRGLGVFAALDDFADEFFRTVDVFSLITRYSDSDIGAGGGVSPRDEALDYDLFFLGVDGSVVHGVPVLDFIEGWTLASLADNFLVRWFSPVPARGVFIFALAGDGHDGTVQIDAVIASIQLMPAPATLALALLGYFLAALCCCASVQSSNRDSASRREASS